MTQFHTTTSIKKKTVRALAQDVFQTAHSAVYDGNLHFSPLPDDLVEALWMSDPARLSACLDDDNVDDMLDYLQKVLAH